MRPTSDQVHPAMADAYERLSAQLDWLERFLHVERGKLQLEPAWMRWLMMKFTKVRYCNVCHGRLVQDAQTEAWMCPNKRSYSAADEPKERTA